MASVVSIMNRMRGGRRRVLRSMVVFAVLIAAGAAAPASSLAACPNEAIREQQGSTYLPECRAYEMVSPLGSAPTVTDAHVAALDGERFLYASNYPYPGEKSDSIDLVSRRGESGWSTEPVTPPQGGINSTDLFACAPFVFPSAEITAGVLSDGVEEASAEGTRYCEGDVPELVSGEPRGVKNLFLQSQFGGSYQLLDMPPAGVTAANAEFEDATPNLSHILFSDNSRLIPEAPAGTTNLYEWANGAVHMVTVLPNKTIVGGTLADGTIPAQEMPNGVDTHNEDAYSEHAVSEDGETVFFYAGGKLYARENASQEQATRGECSAAEPSKACTVEVDRAAAGALGTSGDGVFVAANAAGTRVFFLDERALVAGSTAFAGKPDLYEYDLSTRTLTDLTLSPTSQTEMRGVLGISEDGSYVYFVADGALTGEQVNEYGAEARAGQPNLYLQHAGTTTYVATLNEGDSFTWGSPSGRLNEGRSSAEVSRNGEYVAFPSSAALTGASSCGAGCSEVFLYSAAANSLRCVSCAPAGVTPTAGAGLRGSTGVLLDQGPNMATHGLTNNGELFFESAQPLLTRATNGEVNVYEYRNGKVSLISSGTGVGRALFEGASLGGANAFFVTGEALVATDTDNLPSLYDARIGGGRLAAAQETGVAGPCEEAAACRPPATEPPVEAFGASTAFSGPPDLAPSEASLPEPNPSRSTHKAEREQTGNGTGKGERDGARARRLKHALSRCEHMAKRKRARCRRRVRQRLGGGHRGKAHSGPRSRRKSRRSHRRGHGHGKRSAR